MNEYPGSDRWQDDYPDDDWDFLGPDSEIEAERTAYATESMSKYVREAKPDHPWKDVAKRETIMKVVRLLEKEESIMGLSTHFLSISRRL